LRSASRQDNAHQARDVCSSAIDAEEIDLIMEKPIRPIHTRRDHKTALAEIERMMNRVKKGTPDGDRFEVLVTLVVEYERHEFPIGPPDPVQAILFRMDQMGLTRNDLVPIFGTRSRVSEVLARKRALTLSMIRKLHAMLDIPAESLIAL
jgi:HTH-type transcriptional regulator / antitoxin HigA